MREHEIETGGACELCGELVVADEPSNFSTSEGAVVCHACARRFGGLYDTEFERWSVPPKLPASLEVDRDR